jgi:hypothetical protein
LKIDVLETVRPCIEKYYKLNDSDLNGPYDYIFVLIKDITYDGSNNIFDVTYDFSIVEKNNLKIISQGNTIRKMSEFDIRNKFNKENEISSQEYYDIVCKNVIIKKI